MTEVIKTAAYSQLKTFVDFYKKILPIWTFPYVMLSFAAVFQVLAWFGGILFPGLSLVPRVFTLWGFALVEYWIMSPTMSAAVELLGYSQSFLIILNHVIPFLIFIILNIFLFKSKFTERHAVAMLMVFGAVFLIHHDK